MIEPITVASARAMVRDSQGYFFDPLSLPHSYSYTGNGLLQTDTCTDGTTTWVKTFAYTGSQLVSESQWVRQ